MAAVTEPISLESLQNLRMPPFPVPPPGVTIMPFKDFKPSGIRVPIDEIGDEIEPEDGAVEIDALGIPTVVMRVKHTMDKTEKFKRRKKVKAPTVTTAEMTKPRTWWDAWEESEQFRRNSYDKYMPPVDRLVAASQDFTSGRTMTMYVSNIWDQFRVYVGLLVNPNQQKRRDDDEEEDDLDDFEDAEGKVDDGPRIIEVDVSGAPRAKKEKEKVSQALWESIVSPLSERFLDDPELSIKIFFSSYFRDKGLLWNAQRCIAFPILIDFFLRYLDRNKVFTEPEIAKSLKRALEVTKLASAQLPASSKIGNTLPDIVSSGCRTIWGSKRPLWAEADEQDSALAQDIVAQEQAQAEVLARVEADMERRRLEDEERVRLEEEERAAKRQKLEPEFEKELKAAAEPGAGWGMDGDQATDGGWGSAGDSWGTAGNGWGPENTSEGSAWGAPSDAPLFSAWDESEVSKKAEADVLDAWRLPEPSLMELLGATALPLTHRPAVVEKSTRRITAVHAPAPGRACKHAKGPSAEAVEEELTRRCARIVLEPWPRVKADTEIDRPRILPASRGLVNLSGAEGIEGHSPLRDAITVLIEPKSAEVLQPVIGMGIGATWVQLVHTEEGSKKSKGKKNEEFWYMEELFQQIPSFYTDMPADEE